MTVASMFKTKPQEPKGNELRENHRVSLKLNDREIVYQLAWHPLHRIGVPFELEVAEVMARFVQPGDFVVDGGANVGMCTLILSRFVGDTGMVFAVEPDPANCLQLFKNLELNKVHNVTCINNALWSEDCFKEFHTMDLYNASSSFFPYDSAFSSFMPAIKVFARRLDSILNGNPLLSKPRLIKLDCEGAEDAILHGAEKILRNGVDCIIVELNFPILKYVGTTEHSIRDYMHSLGYDCFALSPEHRPIFIAPHLRLEPLGGDGHINVMFAHADEVVKLWEGSDLPVAQIVK